MPQPDSPATKQRLAAVESQLCDVLISQEQASRELNQISEEISAFIAKLNELAAAASKR